MIDVESRQLFRFQQLNSTGQNLNICANNKPMKVLKKLIFHNINHK